ncbi:uncharacterized protein [Dendrobates tinctorius]|uniref:uncharacterized protein n=1 Tax=Dendrobates tinctorius TaxID=92724 RepID=UPI003CC9EA01
MMVSRSTICSTREPAFELPPSGVIPSETATGDHIEVSDPSVPSLLSRLSIPSTSTGAAGQSSSHEAAGDYLEFPLPHPSDTAATSRPTFGSGRQRQKDQERMTLSDCLNLNSTIQNAFRILGQQLTSGLNMINQSIMELRSYMEWLNAESNQTPIHIFFHSVVRQMEGLNTHQQMHVMQVCHNALVAAVSEASHSTHAPHSTVLLPLFILPQSILPPSIIPPPSIILPPSILLPLLLSLVPHSILPSTFLPHCIIPQCPHHTHPHTRLQCSHKHPLFISHPNLMFSTPLPLLILTNSVPSPPPPPDVVNPVPSDDLSTQQYQHL